MNRERSLRAGIMTALASFALVALAACGSVSSEVERHDVTRVPVVSDAAAQATREGPSEAAATPASGAAGAPAASPAGEAAPAAQGAAPVTIVSHDIFFEPTEVTIPADTDVTFNLPNEGAAAHNFSIDELGVSVDIAPGETQEVVINAPAGTYEYYCNVPGHKEAGMVGTLTVSAEAAAPAAATPVAAESAATPTGRTPVVPAAEEATPPAATPGAATPVSATPAAASPAAAGAAPAAAAPLEVVSHDIFFEPTELSIPANTDVAVTLPNEGVTMHNFSIDALGISVDIQPGATEQTVINAAPGTYEFYCNVPGHKQAGMLGTLTVG